MKIKNGTVTNAMMEYTELSFAFCSGFSIAERKEKYAPYISSKIKIDVSRGSQFQNEPQLNFAQIEPVMVARMQNINPISAAENATISRLLSLVLRYLIAYTIDVKNARTEIHDIGTCRYIILALSPNPGIKGIGTIIAAIITKVIIKNTINL